MPEYIEKETAINAINALRDSKEGETGAVLEKSFAWAAASRKVEQIPAADVAPVVHGRWEHGSSQCDPFCEVWQCSYCGAEDENGMCYNFCPNCGTKMDLEVCKNENT